MNFYNEIDPKAAAWLRELITSGLIPPGVVDERSITEIKPSELTPYVQCHFFCGIAGWPLALAIAGWDPARPVWTGSCPCQPFSSAGKGLGTADERHLWPTFFDLIKECRPQCVFGEQVASAIGKGWLDGVSADLEREGYACGAVVLGAHSIGAPHIRQRLFWVADSASPRRNGALGRAEGEAWDEARMQLPRAGSTDSGLADSNKGQRGRLTNGEGGQFDGAATGRQQGDSELESSGADGGMGDTSSKRLQERGGDGAIQSDQGRAHARKAAQLRGNPGGLEHTPGDGREQRRPESSGRGVERGRGVGGMGNAESGEQRGAREPGSSIGRELPLGGPSAWSNFDLIPCRDGKARRVESGTFPLVNGLPRGVVPSCDPSAPGYAKATAEARVMRLKGYGNAIVPELAAEFVSLFL